MARKPGIHIDPQVWVDLKADLDKFPPVLLRELRKDIRNVGSVAAENVKRRLGLPSPDDGPDKGSGRAALIRATRVGVSFRQRTAGASIVTSSRLLPEQHKGLLNVYNKRKKFRHPVFGDRQAWVQQQGRPYFRPAIFEVIDRDLEKAMKGALEKAMKSMGARNV